MRAMETFWKDAFKITVLLNPGAVLAAFLALTGNRGAAFRRRIAALTALTTLAAGCVVLFSGTMIFSLLDINLNQFRVGGGIILMICAIMMVWGREDRISGGEMPDSAISVVPLAIPMAMGPGTTAGLIVIAGEHGSSGWECGTAVSALAAGVLVLFAVLTTGALSERWFNRTILSVITRLTGLFLSAIAAKMILIGVGNSL